jgi:hypothetical protein
MQFHNPYSVRPDASIPQHRARPEVSKGQYERVIHNQVKLKSEE